MVLIHAEVKLGILSPFLRAAVPLFFITSGYFFFKKIDTFCTAEKRRTLLVHFIKRNMALYGFWFVALLPVTLYIRDWFSGSLIDGILRFLQSFFFNSTFRASWYLMALNIGMCIVLKLSLKCTAGTQLILTFPVYLLCCLFTNYRGLAEQSPIVMSVYNNYVSIFRSLSNSFPVALLWLSLGRFFAQNKIKCNKKKLNIQIVVFAAGLIVEYLLVSHFGLQRGDDAYIMLIPLCCAVFCRIKDAKCVIGSNRRLGHISTIIYASHASVIMLVGFMIRQVLGADFVGDNWLIFTVSMLVCIVICRLIFTVEKYCGFHWLCYAY